MHLLFGLGFLESGELALGKDEAFLRRLRFEGFQAKPHGGEIVPDPDGADAKGRDYLASFQKLVGDANWPQAGCSMASATTTSSMSGATRFFRIGLRLDIS